jgi:hypothetical protein
MTFKIDRETAEAEFLRWCDTCRIDTDFDETTDEGSTRCTMRLRLVKAIQNGAFAVDESGVGFMSADVKGEKVEVRFKNQYGGILAVMDRKKEGQNQAKLNASLAALTGLPDATFAAMHSTDLKICHAVILLFLV